MNFPSLDQDTLSTELNSVGQIVLHLVNASQNDPLAILNILRKLESLHQEIRINSFEEILPNSRHLFYPLLKDIADNGGWPYIERMKLQTLLKLFDLQSSEVSKELSIDNPKTIKFGTDGWRGVIADDFTFERVALVAPIAASILEQEYGSQRSRRIIVGYDRRFLAQEFAQVAANAIASLGFEVLLSECFAPTPAFSWAVKSQNALGAIVLTASHNPAKYLGLKVKGAFGSSVGPELTQKIEEMLANPPSSKALGGSIKTFDPWFSYCQELRTKINLDAIQNAVSNGQLKIFSNPMYGSATGGLYRLLEVPVYEVNDEADPLFGGNSPEPIPRYLGDFMQTIKTSTSPEKLRIGLVFDGDGDRIAAIDGQGNYLSSQNLIPILIEHLATRRGFSGEIIKTVSGSDLFAKLAKHFNLPIFETEIGYKYIADRMQKTKVLIGGEESGGIGYGNHIPERDALLSALYVLEAVVESRQDLSTLYSQLQKKVGFFSSYDRIDLPLADMDVRNQLIEGLQNDLPKVIARQNVIDCSTIDGYKLRLADNRWLLIRFSGTEPVLRLYCEASDSAKVEETLEWAKNWANSIE
jgi:phosphomannomutase